MGIKNNIKNSVKELDFTLNLRKNIEGLEKKIKNVVTAIKSLYKQSEKLLEKINYLSLENKRLQKELENEKESRKHQIKEIEDAFTNQIKESESRLMKAIARHEDKTYASISKLDDRVFTINSTLVKEAVYIEKQENVPMSQHLISSSISDSD